jgi:hypothetical protein
MNYCYYCHEEAHFVLCKSWEYNQDDKHQYDKHQDDKNNNKYEHLCVKCHQKIIKISENIDSYNCIDKNGINYVIFPNPPLTDFERINEKWFLYKIR